MIIFPYIYRQFYSRNIMARNQIFSSPKSHNLSKDISNRQLEINYRIAKKILQHFDLDPNLFDTFTKKQRHQMLSFLFDQPSIKPEVENSIPRQYLLLFRSKINAFLKERYWGNPENKLSYMEVATNGVAFMHYFRSLQEEGNFFTAAQQETAQLIHDRIAKDDNEMLQIFASCLGDMFAYIHLQLRLYSQINFRQYGFTHSWGVDSGTRPRLLIRFTVEECQTKTFLYQGIYRKAFLLRIAPNGMFDEFRNATMPKHWIIPEMSKKYFFNIYVQSHVLHRFKERFDCSQPADRNLLMHFTLTDDLRVVSSSKQKLIACSIKMRDMISHPIGYFSFFTQQNDLVLKTFLPLASETTPEGERFHKIIPLSKEDMTYVGMDKVSFFLEVDFEQIPFLKQALIDSGMWDSVGSIRNFVVTTNLETGEEINPIDESKTRFVKNFFDKLQVSMISEADFSDITDEEEEAAETANAEAENSEEEAKISQEEA
jgi:hypothetical protein